jgi:hypothetical protein
MSVAPESGRNRIMIYGPRNDGTYVVEFKTTDGEALAINVPVGETRVLKHFQERMPMGCSCRMFREKECWSVKKG